MINNNWNMPSQPGGLTPNITTGTSLDPFASTAKLGTYVTFPKYASVPGSGQQLSKDHLRKQLKIFIHFAKQWVVQNPSWIIEPNASRPFESVVLVQPIKHLRILDKFPMNELEITGLTHEQSRTLHPEFYDGDGSMTVSFQDFQAWALGIDPLPDILQ